MEANETNKDTKNTNNEPGFAVQIGETLQGAIISVLDGSSTIFRSVLGTFKDSAVFAIRSKKEVSNEFGSAVTDSIKKTIGETKEISIESTKVGFGFVNEIGKNLKSSTLGTIEGTHEVSTKAANTFGRTIVDLSQCAYDTGAKIGNIAKSTALNTIRGTSEISEELFGKIKSGVGGVINLENLRFRKKKVVNAQTIDIEKN